jgi:hypothetical protein
MAGLDEVKFDRVRLKGGNFFQVDNPPLHVIRYAGEISFPKLCRMGICSLNISCLKLDQRPFTADQVLLCPYLREHILVYT